MKTVHWLAIILLMCIFTFVGVFSTVALVKEAFLASLNEHFPEITPEYNGNVQSDY